MSDSTARTTSSPPSWLFLLRAVVTADTKLLAFAYFVKSTNDLTSVFRHECRSFGQHQRRWMEAFVVSLALSSRVNLYASKPIVAEYERVLRYPRLRFVPEDIFRFLRRLRQSFIEVVPLGAVIEALLRTASQTDSRLLRLRVLTSPRAPAASCKPSSAPPDTPQTAP